MFSMTSNELSIGESIWYQDKRARTKRRETKGRRFKVMVSWLAGWLVGG